MEAKIKSTSFTNHESNYNVDYYEMNGKFYRDRKGEDRSHKKKSEKDLMEEVDEIINEQNKEIIQKRQNHIAACIASALAMMDEAGVPYSITIGKGEIRK